MKIILSPTKSMRTDDALPCTSLPACLLRTEELLALMKGQSCEQLKALWSCSDAIARKNFERFEVMNLRGDLTPAVFSYEGLAFQYMMPDALTQEQLAYVQAHLRILSGFYGMLRPLDGVRPYRLDMEDKLDIPGFKDLYAFWGSSIYDLVRDESGVFLNLASKEYSRCIERYLTPRDTLITCVFADRVRGKLVQKATFSKMARGEMVRYLAENQIEDPEQMKAFDRLNFHFRPELSSPCEYVFERMPE